MIVGVLFSRLDPSLILDGISPLSQAIYILSIIAFIVYSIYLYLKDTFKIKNELIFIAVWLFTMLIAVRGAVRFFFVITPLFCFMVGYFLNNLKTYAQQSKEDLMRMVSWLLLTFAILLLITNSFTLSTASIQQAKYTGPSANVQWQEAMSWVRENTQEGAVFLHWWDYGYWVEYLGERYSVTDGGHAEAYWDHLVGRYVLTTPYPETAFSFMKTQNVSYLLIDPSDIGKYPAYSKIGSDENGEDRLSMIPTMILNPSQTIDTVNGTRKFYRGGVPLDQDIIYSFNGTKILLPKEKAGLVGFVLDNNNKENTFKIMGVFNYDKQQITIPIRYIYYSNQLFDSGQGLNSAVYLFPKIDPIGNGQVKIDEAGALMYFSEKTMPSLIAQNYIFNNAMGGYDNLELVHTQPTPIVTSLKEQGIFMGDFIYFNGVQAPIKIWKVHHAENIKVIEGFTKRGGDFAEFDDYQFIK